MHLVQLLCCLTILSWTASCAHARSRGTDPPETRPVEVQITVTAQVGTLPDLVVVTFASGGKQWGAKCNANGTAVVTIEVPINDECFSFDIPASPDPQARVVGTGDSPWRAAARQLHTSFSVPPPRKVRLQPNQSSYSATISLPAAVTVRGQAVDASSSPVNRFSADRGRGWPTLRFKTNNNFEVVGVERGKRSWLFFEGFNGAQVKIVQLSPTQTLQDVDLGKVTLAAENLDSSLELDGTGRDARTSIGLGSEDAYITLIHESGTRGYVFDWNESNRAQWVKPATTPRVSVAAGRYYAVPGLPFIDGCVVKVLRLMQAGRLADVEAAVPVITTTSGQVTTATMDVGKVKTAIDAIKE